MKGSELKDRLKEAGCRKVSEDANHERWYSPITERNFWVPRHDSKEIKSGTLHKILKDAGVR